MSRLHDEHGFSGSPYDHRYIVDDKGHFIGKADDCSLITLAYDDGDTMLMRAVGRGHVDIVRYLAALGLTRHGALQREV
jgi:hypothetical protein